MNKQPTSLATRNYWTWVTKPEYYRGLENLEVDQPGSASEDGESLGWWTCHKDTRAGDLVLLYRTSPKSDLAYLLEAGSDARILEYEPPTGTIFERDYKVLLQSALKGSSEIRSLQERTKELEEELDSLEKWLESGLKSLETSLDHKLMKEYNELWDAIEQLDSLEEEFLEEKANEIQTFEQERVALEEAFGESRATLDRRFEEFKKRSSEQSTTFQKFYEKGDKVDASLQELDQVAEDLRLQVLEWSGLAKDTVLEFDPDFSGDYVCDWVLRHKWEYPLPLSLLKTDAFLTKEWNALRASFKGRVFRTWPDIWDRLVDLAQPENPGLASCLKSLAATRVSPDIASELAIEEFLSHNLDMLRPLFDLELHESPLGRSGRQFSCPEASGFIDLLCRDRKTGDFVVIELKAKRAGRDVAGQIKTYMGWVKMRLAGPNQAVSGLIIADGYDRKLKYALADMENVGFLDLAHFWPAS